MSVGRPQGRSVTGPGVGPFLAGAWFLLVVSLLLWFAAQVVTTLTTRNGWLAVPPWQAPLVGARTLQYRFDLTAGWPEQTRDQLGSVPLIWFVFAVEMFAVSVAFYFAAKWWTRRFMGPAGARVVATTATKTMELGTIDLTDRNLRDHDLGGVDETHYEAVGAASHPGAQDGSVAAADRPLTGHHTDDYLIDSEPGHDAGDIDDPHNDHDGDGHSH